MIEFPYQIGVTGGIGAGKSVVCEIFQSLGVSIYNADDRAKWLMNHHEDLKINIIAEFSEKAYNDEGLDRQYLAKNVFHNQHKLNLLNNMVHPMVSHDYDQWVMNHQDNTYLVKEAALIFEGESYKKLDKIIVVTAPEQLRIERVLKRDPQRDVKQIKEIISQQMSISEAINRTDYVIKNDEMNLLLPKVLELHEMFSSE